MTRIPIFAALALTLAACGSQPASDFATVLPDDRLLIDLPTTAGGARSAAGEISEYHGLSADVAHDLNQLIGEVLAGIEEITSFDPTWADADETRALWGPWEDGGVNGRLWVEQDDEGAYAWAVEAKLETEGEDAWTTVYVGEIEAGATDVTSTGRMAIDFAGASAYDPDHDVTGMFYVEYAVDGDVVDATAAFEGFSEDGGPMADAGVAYSEDGVGGGSMDLGVKTDEWGGPLAELHVIRTRWTPSGEGRADVYLTEGDFGELVYSATECWDGGQTVVFWEDNYEFNRSGDEASCAFGEPEFSEEGV